MEPTIVRLNNDTSWFLRLPNPSNQNHHFQILIDPWLTGPYSIIHGSLLTTHHPNPPAFSSITQIVEKYGKIDAVLLSVAIEDHIHSDTLLGLEDKNIPIFGSYQVVQFLAKEKKLPNPVYLIPEPPYAPKSVNQQDLSQFSLRSLSKGREDMPTWFYLTYMQTQSYWSSKLVRNAVLLTWEQPQSETPFTGYLYTAHGAEIESLKFVRLLVEEKLLEMRGVMTGLKEVLVPWYLGGSTLNALGLAGAMKLVETFKPKYLVVTHDEEKNESTTGLLSTSFTWVSASVEEAVEGVKKRDANTQVVEIENGGAFELC